MTERRAWNALRRRWWAPMLLAVLVGALTILQQRPWEPRPFQYAVSLSFSVGVQPQGPIDAEEAYYGALASEYLVDDLAEVVRGSEFAAAVSKRLDELEIQVPAGAIQGSTQAGKLHRILTLTITWGDAEELATIAEAAAAVLEEDAARFMPRLFAQPGAAYLIDRSGIHPLGPRLRERWELPLRVLLALIAGLGLIAFWEYLDDTIRERSDLEALGWEVVGEIPQH